MENKTYFSILGDSISTCIAYNPPGYAVYYDTEMLRSNRLTSARDTWWGKVILTLQAGLCVNDSYSGSKVSGNAFPAAGSDARLLRLRSAERIPDVILIYAGFNDFASGIPIHGKSEAHGGADLNTFSAAYDAMLQKIHRLYPDTKVICGTLMRTQIQGNPFWDFPESGMGYGLEEYNCAIRAAVEKNGCLLADLGALGARYETMDGSHPNAKGHQTLADAWLTCLNQLGFAASEI